MRFGLLVAAFCAILTGCATTPSLGTPSEGLVVTQQTDLPPPTGADLIQSNQPYLIGPLDKLTVNVFGIEDLSGEVQADASGSLSLPLVGVVDAAGLTPQQLAVTIASRLGRYVRNPQVTVNLKEATSQTFTVDGQVAQPGIYPVVGNMSLMRAIATAKGASEYAQLRDVVVFRTVGGQSMAAVYNLGSIRRGIYADPKIYSNDIIVVGDSPSRRMVNKILQIAPTLTTPLILLLQ
jgi:polysaccharide export outer membrane protein